MSLGDAMVMQESDGKSKEVQINVSGHCPQAQLVGRQ
jgi:hypothetical protein